TWVLAGCTVIALTACGAYYLWTRSVGPKPTAVGQTNWQTLCFVIYELLGFNGLGTGRLALREHGIGALKVWVPILVMYGATVMLVLFAVTRRLVPSFGVRSMLLAALALSVPAMFQVAVGFFSPFRVLGRHFAPL